MMNTTAKNASPDSNFSAATPKISFLIPMYNGLELTRNCVRTLAETVDLSEHEVILVNDASTDGTAEFLAQLPPPHRVVTNPQRSSYAVGMNRGVAIARGEILCLLNNDLIFLPGWLPPMVKALEQLPRIGFVGNVQINPRERAYDHMGVVFDTNGMPWHFGKHFLFRPFRGYTEWKAVTAACCLIKKSVFLEAGGFDEAYKNGCEDVSLCLTLHTMGYRHYVANASVIQHLVSSSEGRHDFNSKNEQRMRDQWQNRVKEGLTSRDHRLFAANYLLRFITQPWRYNWTRFKTALLTLLKFGNSSRCLHPW